MNEVIYENDYEGKHWWELLDWSMMRETFYMLSPPMRTLIKEEDYWSKGIEVFEWITFADSIVPESK